MAAALLASLVLAAPSEAQTFCVAAPEGCAGTAASTIQAALDAAAGAPGRDRVEVGFGVEDPAASFTVAAGNAVDVVGVGDPWIFLDEHAPGIAIAEPTAVVSGLHVLTAVGGPAPAIDVAAGTLRDSIVESGGVDPVIRLGAGTLDGLEFPSNGPHSVGVRAVGPGGVIADSQVFAETAVESSSDDLVVRRSILEGRGWSSSAAALRVTAGKVTADDVGAYMSGDAAGTVGVDVAPGAGSAELALRSTTVRGDGQPTLATGVRASCAGGGSATVALLDTVVFGYDTDLQRAAPGCAMSLDHVRYRTRDAGTGGTFADGPGVTVGPVGPFGTWVDPGFDSPLIDAGSARADAEVDLNGRPRVADGDGDGTATRDIGAVEYQRRAPHALLSGQVAYLGTEWELYDDGSWDPDGGDEGRLSFAWTIDGAPVAPADVDAETGAVRHTFTTLGEHAVTLTVTDPTGLSDTATSTVKVLPVPVYEDDDPGDGDGGPPPIPPAPTQPGPGTTIVPPGPPVTPTTRPSTRKPPKAVVASLIDLRLHAGRELRVLVNCRNTGDCRGRIALRAGTVTLGRSRAFTLHGGAVRRMTVPISAAGRRLLRRHPKGTKVTVRVLRLNGRTWTNGMGATVTP